MEKYIVYKRNGECMICAYSFKHLLDEDEIITVANTYREAERVASDLTFKMFLK